MKEFEHLMPKSVTKKVSWNISENTLTILSYYAKYSLYEEEQVVDMFLVNLLTNNDFITWVNKQRNKKRIEPILKQYGLLIDEVIEEGVESNGEDEEVNF